MKKSFIALIIFAAFMTASAQEESVTEFRGVWLTNVDSYVLTTDAKIVEAMNYLDSIGINVVFPVVYNKGYTLYPSAVMDSLFNAPTIPDPSYSNRDFLERLIIEAHRVGIEVIPWFEFGFSTSYSQNGGHIIAEFPHWALKDRNGDLVVKNGFDWMSAINPEAQDFILSLITEVIDNYDVDGIQGDDRLPAMPVEGGYDSVTVEIYKSEHSGSEPPFDFHNSDWKRWRADKLNEYFLRIRDSVKARGNQFIVASSPTPYPWGYNEYLQDSKTWAADGIVDNIVPQLYRYDLTSYDWTLQESLREIRSVNPDIYNAGVLIKAGTYVIEPSLLLQKIALNRDSSVAGECFFFYEGLRANNNENGDTLLAAYYGLPAKLPYRNGNTWRPKASITNETDPGAAVIGTWETYQMSGYRDGILRTNETTNFAAVEYTLDVPAEAWYDVFVYRVPNIPWTQQAFYTFYGAADSVTASINQSDLTKMGWHKAATVYLNQGSQRVVKVDNTQLESGKYLIADAVMITINRKLSPNVIITSVDDDRSNNEIPDTYQLLQNYPNPFNPATTIAFTLPSVQDVKLTVHNILGEQIAVIVNEELSAGSYQYRYNASHLSSGVYFYRLQAGAFSETKKMLLLR